MRNTFRALAAISSAVLASSTGVQAATTLLTFDDINDPNPRPACASFGGNAGPTTQVCSVETQRTGNDYGSTSELAITYNRTTPDGRTATGTLQAPDLLFLRADGNGVGSSFGDVNNAGRITFTPAAGYEVSFDSFDFVDRNSPINSATFSLTDSMGNSVFNFTSLVLTQRTTYAANTAFFSGPLSFVFDGIGRSVPSVDNVRLTTRQIGVISAVPEPASWAMMICGFGFVGTALRRRRRDTIVFA